MAKDPSKIKKETRDLIESSDNELVLSVITFWEIGIKKSIGKLKLNMPVDDFAASAKEEYGLTIIPITMDHVLGINALEMIHKDPFDRLLVSISKKENLSIISSDEIFDEYKIERVW